MFTAQKKITKYIKRSDQAICLHGDGWTVDITEMFYIYFLLNAAQRIPKEIIKITLAEVKQCEVFRVDIELY